MSVFAEGHPNTDPAALAESIDQDFRFVAERIPTDLKRQPAGSSMELCRVEGVGNIEATYLGKTRYGSDPRDNFNVSVRMTAEGYGGELGFEKQYALTHGSYNRPGPVVDRQPTKPEDFEGCPAPIETLGFTVNALTKAFSQPRSL